jgi:hypothetical protein
LGFGAYVFETNHDPTSPVQEPVGGIWTPIASTEDQKADMEVIIDEWEGIEKKAANVIDSSNLSGIAPQKTTHGFEEMYFCMPALTVSA